MLLALALALAFSLASTSPATPSIGGSGSDSEGDVSEPGSGGAPGIWGMPCLLEGAETNTALGDKRAGRSPLARNEFVVSTGGPPEGSYCSVSFGGGSKSCQPWIYRDLGLSVAFS